jgi:hypothetical protein
MGEQSVEFLRGLYAAFGRGDVAAVHVWDIRDGKVTRFRQFIDTVRCAEVAPADASVAS